METADSRRSLGSGCSDCFGADPDSDDLSRMGIGNRNSDRQYHYKNPVCACCGHCDRHRKRTRTVVLRRICSRHMSGTVRCADVSLSRLFPLELESACRSAAVFCRRLRIERCIFETQTGIKRTGSPLLRDPVSRHRIRYVRTSLRNKAFDLQVPA